MLWHIAGDMKRIYLFLILVLVVVGFGCTQSSSSGENNKIKPVEFGILEGRITIGPLCPVERDPPDPSCLPTAKTFAANPVFVKAGSENIAKLEPTLNGSYELELAVGDYTVVSSKVSRIGKQSVPQDITITSNTRTELNIHIDTGIR